MPVLVDLKSRLVASRTAAHSSKVAQGCSSMMSRSATARPTLVSSSRRMQLVTVSQIFPSDMF